MEYVLAYSMDFDNDVRTTKGDPRNARAKFNKLGALVQERLQFVTLVSVRRYLATEIVLKIE